MPPLRLPQALVEEPPRTQVIKWLRINLAVTTAIVGAVGAGCGSLVTATWRLAQYDDRATAMDGRITSLENDRHERDDRRVKLANDLGSVNQRIGVVEETAKNTRDFVRDYFQFMGNRLPPSAIK